MPGQFKSGWPEYDLPRFSGRWIRYGVIGLVVLVLLISSVYQIRPEEIGVILRFGRFVRTTEPGLHFKLPLGMEKLTRVPVQRQLKLEFGYRTVRPGVKSEYYVNDETRKESMMLTGDLNVVVAEWIVQYKIKDPYRFLFKVRDPVQTFRAMTEAVIRQVVGDASVDEVITFGRAGLAAEAMASLQKLVDAYELGLEVNQLIFQDVNPPDTVKPSFNEVNQALQEKERKINEAWAEYNQEIPKAQGEAEQMIRAAEGYASERVNNARGDAARFISIYREYAKAPAVTRKRLYLETLSEVLAKIDKKIVVDEAQKNLVPLLNLGEEVKK
ncbi:MAG: FtsH protease activity modulator HflK [Candidatus Saccharicenans sp.]|jgi:membrane protease subunit HflK|nr:FtsH protease activity modulator HflK [Candidatus Saccharicenans sp.]MDH7492543.1 FtsH protease activity modulator HflK [Candidatus Saccharicenans sp.]